MPGELVRDGIACRFRVQRFLSLPAEAHGQLLQALSADALDLCSHSSSTSTFARLCFSPGGVTELARALQEPEGRTEATDALRGLVDAIVLTPDQDGETLRIELKGNLAAMLGATRKTKRSSESDDPIPLHTIFLRFSTTHPNPDLPPATTDRQPFVSRLLVGTCEALGRNLKDSRPSSRSKPRTHFGDSGCIPS